MRRGHGSWHRKKQIKQIPIFVNTLSGSYIMKHWFGVAQKPMICTESFYSKKYRGDFLGVIEGHGDGFFSLGVQKQALVSLLLIRQYSPLFISLGTCNIPRPSYR